MKTLILLAQLTGNSYSLEQMQSDNNRSALELQQQEIWHLEERQNRQRQRMDDIEYENSLNRPVPLFDMHKNCRARYCS